MHIVDHYLAGLRQALPPEPLAELALASGASAAQLALPAVILLGCGIGSLFPLSLIVSMDHVHDPAGAGALLGFVQGGGYIIASSMPFIAGLIRQHSSSLAQAWMVMAGGVVLLLLIAVRFAPGARLAQSR